MLFSAVKKFIILMMILVGLSSPVLAQEATLVGNAGFEEGEGTPISWETAVWNQNGGAAELQWESGDAHTGTKCAGIINNAPNHARYMQKVTVKPDTVYRISGWIKAVNIGSNGKGANLSVEGIRVTSRDIRGSNGDWEYVEFYGRTGRSQDSFVLTLALGGYGSLNTGKAYFDDINMEETMETPQAAVISLSGQPGDGQDASTPEDRTILRTWTLLAVVLLFLLALVLAFLTKKPLAFLSGKSDKQKLAGAKDLVIMAVLLLVYLPVVLYNLGDLSIPRTSWQPAREGESFVIRLDKEYDISRITYFNGSGLGKFKIQYLTQDGGFAQFATIDKKQRDFYRWGYNIVSAKTRELKVTVVAPGGELKELGLFARGSRQPLPVGPSSIAEKSNGSGSVENLFDEQDRVAYSPSYLNGMYFDEIYHARTAFEHLHLLPFYENTHPPLGKLMIGLGILFSGMNPFGWRVVGALLGAIMLPVMYLFGRKLFVKRFYGFMAAFLTMVDFMHFTQSRIATIDIFAMFFVILMYYFMYDSFTRKADETEYRLQLKPLLLSGLCFGIGVACKWIGLYAGAGLAILYCAAGYRDYKRAGTEVMKKKVAQQTALYGILFFAVLPLFIYILSYLPVLLTPGNGQGLQTVWNYQTLMFNYHTTLRETHPYQSAAWTWPWMLRPQCFYYTISAEIPAGKYSTIVTMGNPAIWWFGILAVLASAVIVLRKRDRKMLVVFAALVFQYLPWFFIQRSTFIYHFFSSVPFVILCIVYLWRFLLEEFPGWVRKVLPGGRWGVIAANFTTYSVFVYLAVAAALFILFYPALSGMVADKSYIHQLRWFKTWVF